MHTFNLIRSLESYEQEGATQDKGEERMRLRRMEGGEEEIHKNMSGFKRQP